MVPLFVPGLEFAQPSLGHQADVPRKIFSIATLGHQSEILVPCHGLRDLFLRARTLRDRVAWTDAMQVAKHQLTLRRSGADQPK
jgi:hypothetical protein